MHEHTVRVTTAAGTVEGFTRDGVHRWRSIPYAQAPVGALRFRAPRPAQPWPGVRYCHGFTKCAPARPALHDHGRRQVPTDGRGLPHPQCRHTGSSGRRTAARDGLRARRRVHHGQLGHADLRRGGSGSPRLRLCVGELPARRAGLPGSVVAVDGRHQDRQQLVPARSGVGLALDQRERRRVRR